MRNASTRHHVGYFAFAFSLLAFGLLLTNSVSAQGDQNDVAPPPTRIIPKEDLIKLDTETDVKSRTKLALEMMSNRITAAEKFNTAEDFPGVFRELGVFHGLMDNSLDYLNRKNSNNGKVLDNFKRLEIGLRGFGPRIEGIYRDLPHRFEEYVRKLLKYIRDARTKATDPLFSDSVMPIKPDK
ncbi:hypothetical protein BH10ACI2_BH10ACI2_19700 [soil metagenome]